MKELYVLLKNRDPFGLISPDEFEKFGIDPDDVSIGTVVSLRYPAQIPSRFGGNAYGLGLIEGYNRLSRDELDFILSVNLNDERSVSENYKKINEIYKKLGLLVRFSKKGKPYYLIPIHLISSSLTEIKVKVDEVIRFIKEISSLQPGKELKIAVFSSADNIIFQEISFIFLEHTFFPVDSIRKLKDIKEQFDVFIILDDLYEIVIKEIGLAVDKRRLRRKLEEWVNYLLLKIYRLLKENGYFFIISKYYKEDTEEKIRIKFSEEELKNFALFTHVFKTKERYKFNGRLVYVNSQDFQNYLNEIYVEPEILNRLLKGKRPEKLSLEEINSLPYLDLRIPKKPFRKDQKSVWLELFERYFEKIKIEEIVPESLKREWEKRFTFYQYEPKYLILYKGKKKRLPFDITTISRDILKYKLFSSPPELIPDYRNSFDYVFKVLEVIENLKKDSINHRIPKIFIDRLKTPLLYKERRYKGMGNVLRLIRKKNRLKKIINYFNPDNIEGSDTKVIENLELLGLFDFDPEILKEIYFICLGHGAIGRIIAGKTDDSALKPIADVCRFYEIKEALNFLRYFRIMSFAEITVAKGRYPLKEEVRELFRIYDLLVRAVISKTVDWDKLAYEGLDSIEGVRSKAINRLLMIMGCHEFLNNWQMMKEKGDKELEILANYSQKKLKQIRNMLELLDVLNKFENLYSSSDPLQMLTFYRKLLKADLHGTARIFSRIRAKNAFLLLWITINTDSETINFNPLLADVSEKDIERQIEKIDKEAEYINEKYLSPSHLKNLSAQLYKNRSTVILGTGFYLRLDPKNNILSVEYSDLEKNITFLKKFCDSLKDISHLSKERLSELENVFSKIELFYQADRELKSFLKHEKLPLRYKRWIKEIREIREKLREIFLKSLFKEENFYPNLEALYRSAPSVINFLFPFFKSLQELDLSWHIYMKLSPVEYMLNTTRKLYALIRHAKEEFQDRELMHKLAKKEFGIMATGTVGVSDSQIESLIGLLENLKKRNPILFKALIKSFLFQEIGRVPELREKYYGRFDPSDLGHAGSVFIREEKISKDYFIEKEEERYLIFLIRYHSLLHHMIRGEISFFAIDEILKRKDKELFDAFFVFSFIMLSAIREDLLLEDLAERLFKVKAICDSIIEGKITLEEYMNKLFSKKQRMTGQSGRKIYAIERIFRLRGIRYVEFPELDSFLKGDSPYLIYKRKGFVSIGYSTFEKELFEAYRTYSSFQELPKEIRDYVLEWLVEDRVRIFGYENVTNYLTYKNQVKLLLLALIGAESFKKFPVSINFLELCQIISKRYEAINDWLNRIGIEEIWEKRKDRNFLFEEKEGIFLKKEAFPKVLTVKFRDKIDIHEKISFMKNIKNITQLDKYYSHLLSVLNEYPFYCDDYRKLVKVSYEKRLKELSEEILEDAKKKMEETEEFKELYLLKKSLMKEAEKAIKIFPELKERIKDLYELRREALEREWLKKIDKRLMKIKGKEELNEYWNNVKQYFKINKKYIGRELELLVAKRFDLKEREFL